MDSTEIQAELDKTQGIVRSRPFQLYGSPLQPPGEDDVPQIRVHWHDEQRRWIFCTRESCSRPHVLRQLRWLSYVDEHHQVDYHLVVASPMLLRAERRWRPGDALVRVGEGVDTHYETCDPERF